MGILQKLFGQSSKPSAPGTPKQNEIRAVVVITPRRVGGVDELFKRIRREQKAKGFTFAPNCILEARTGDPENQQFVITTIRNLGFTVADVDKASGSFFGSLDGNGGKYCIVF